MKQEILSAAIVSAAIAIGLLVGFQLGYIARTFQGTPSPSDVALPKR